MKTTQSFKRFCETMLLWIYMITIINPIPAVMANNNITEKVIYPLKEISKLECRFKDFAELWSECKEKLPILNTKDYLKYSELDWWYNKYTILYTELWWASYEYGWDVWNGWHIWTDIATAKWTPVYSIAEWTVTIAKELGQLWNSITIKHKINWKTVYSNYSHLSKMVIRAWDRVKTWDKIWEVWSTWNSTWNHLHFQIDLETPWHPYYYDYDACPYSYYKITETWLCFNELQKNTIDPLLFLETKWDILNNIEIVTNTIKRPENIKTNPSNSPIPNTTNNNELSIFDRTVYVWYSTDDIMKVQEIYKDLWQYDWTINWDYNDVKDSIINYQLSTWIVKRINEEWVGWFGPKTRAQTKKDYINFLATKSETLNNKDVVIDNNTVETNDITTETITTIDSIKVEKISRKNLMSREQIEAREIDEFLNKYNIDLQLKEVWWNIEKWKQANLKLQITDKRWKSFKGNTPWNITFIVDTTKVEVFPQKLYYFTDGKRDITLKWLDNWNTTLYAKIWSKTIKSIPLKVYSSTQTFYPSSWITIAGKSITIWDTKTAVVLFKDENQKNLINIKYGSTFKIDASEWVKVCIKKWNIKNVRKIYKSACNTEDYKKTIDFSYEDTVGWLLIFDYKVTWKNASVSIVNKYDNKNLSSKSFNVTNPKGLKWDYVYRNDVLKMLENWVVDWINKWYFLEDRELTEKDAIAWINNSLEKIQKETIDPNISKKINENLVRLNTLKTKASKFNTITRQDFLDLSYTYLVFNENSLISRTYLDLDETQELKTSNIFDNKNTWKDQFWEKYYRPDLKITRWEWAFLLSNTIERNRKTFLTLK